MDPQLASEMVVLLGRELQVVRKRVEDLERELREEKSSHQGNKERAEAAEQSMKALTLNVEKFGQENRTLRDELKLLRGVKKEESREIGLSDLYGAKDQTMDEGNVEAVTGLQKQLENLKAEQKAAEFNWLKTYDELTRQLHHLTLEKEGLAGHINESLRYGDGIHEDGEILQVDEAEGDSDAQFENGEVSEEEGEEEEEELEATPAIRNYISVFPQFEGLPHSRLTSPVALKTKGPVPYLASHIGYGNFLYIPAGRIRWYAGKTHAITCGPSFILHNKYWQEHSQFSKFFETTQEIFYAQGSTVHYAGTYKCHQPPDFLPQTIALPGDLSVAAMTDALRIPNTFQEAWADKATLQKLFRHGILKLEYFIMECVGFNHRLYHRMLDLYGEMDVEPTNSSKRKSRPQTNPKKKRKTN